MCYLVKFYMQKIQMYALNWFNLDTSMLSMLKKINLYNT